ncbi:hypothetical protein VDGL01_11048 [Verticillium dahliae]
MPLENLRCWMSTPEDLKSPGCAVSSLCLLPQSLSSMPLLGVLINPLKTVLAPEVRAFWSQALVSVLEPIICPKPQCSDSQSPIVYESDFGRDLFFFRVATHYPQQLKLEADPSR